MAATKVIAPTRTVTVAVTGAQADPPGPVRANLERWLTTFDRACRNAGAGFAVHHGGAAGIDEYATWVCDRLNIRCTAVPADHHGGHFARNRWLVDEADVVFAAPSHPIPRLGGTWYTIDYAISTVTPYRLFLPDGRVALDWVDPNDPPGWS